MSLVACPITIITMKVLVTYLFTLTLYTYYITSSQQQPAASSSTQHPLLIVVRRPPLSFAVLRLITTLSSLIILHISPTGKIIQ